jgi:uncharacterized protein (TIGR02996 family)
MDLEAAFLQDIQDDPFDQDTWLVLADWLREQADPVQQARGEMVHLLHALRHEPAGPESKAQQRRLQELIAAGTPPCVPSLTSSVGIELALIPAGRFLMGSPTHESERQSNEGPAHEVTLTRPFYLGVQLVTLGQFRAFVSETQHKTVPEVDGQGVSGWNTGDDAWENGAEYSWQNPGWPQDDRHPATFVFWEDAVAFCKWLSRKEGHRYRLATEAEWEYACRATTSTPFFFGDTASAEQANFDGHYPYNGALKGRYLKTTTPVGAYPPNPFGLYDMHGNAWEWVADWYESQYPVTPQIDPQGPVHGSQRVLRGGSWYSVGWVCRSARRVGAERGDPHVFGFRVARTIEERDPGRGE